MTEIMPVPRNLILLSYQQGAFDRLFFADFCTRTPDTIARSAVAASGGEPIADSNQSFSRAAR